VDRWFVEELGARHWRRLRDAMRASDGVRDYYNRVAALRGHVRPNELLSDDRLASIGTSIFEAMNETPKRAPRIWLWSLGSAVAGCLAILLVMTAAPRQDDTFQARHASGTAVSIRAFCVDGGGERVDGDERVRAVVTADDATPVSCSLHDTLQLSYATRGAHAPGYVFIVGVDEKARPLWYFPTPDEPHSVAITATSGSEKLLPDSIALDVNHRAGRVWIYGIFTSAPVTIETIRAWIERSSVGSWPTSTDLGVESATVQRLSLTLTP
jgi:hypothetical protein